jgi:hypothetical protein
MGRVADFSFGNPEVHFGYGGIGHGKTPDRVIPHLVTEIVE